MPTYDYACKSCGHQWETVQRISADPLTECPKCHAQTAQRLISGGNFILKGGGWYADLYSSAKPASSASGSGKETKSESKGESSSGSSSTAPTAPSAPAPAKSGSSPKE